MPSSFEEVKDPYVGASLRMHMKNLLFTWMERHDNVSTRHKNCPAVVINHAQFDVFAPGSF